MIERVELKGGSARVGGDRDGRSESGEEMADRGEYWRSEGDFVGILVKSEELGESFRDDVFGQSIYRRRSESAGARQRGLKQELTRAEHQSSQNPNRRHGITLVRLPQFIQRVGDDLDSNSFDSNETRRINRHWCSVFTRDFDWGNDGRIIWVQGDEERLERGESEREGAVVRRVEDLSEKVSDGSKKRGADVPRYSSLPRTYQPILHMRLRRRSGNMRSALAKFVAMIHCERGLQDYDACGELTLAFSLAACILSRKSGRASLPNRGVADKQFLQTRCQTRAE